MMKSRRAVLGAGATGAAAAAIGAFTATPAHALTRPMERDHRSLPSEIRVLMQRLVDRRLVPGLQLAAMRDGRLTLSSSIGRTNLETGSEATNLSIFRIGSVTKQFTAASILRLRALGKISLDDRLKKFFPDLPNAENVSILQMLSHTSGLGNYTDAATRTIFLERARTDYDQAELYAAMKATSPLFLFEPGTHWAYSNTAYVLLGIVVEKITGLPLRKAYRELVLDRAGLKHTDTDDAAEVVPGRASGYTPNAAAAQGFDNSSFVAMSYPGGAGILRSTAEDLCAWHEALFGGRVLASADVVEMTTPARLANGSVAEVPVGPGSPVDYGLGLRLTRQNGRKVVYHGGGIQGFLSKLTTFPESRSTFAWITNTDGGFEPSAQQELSDTLDKLETTLGTMLGV